MTDAEKADLAKAKEAIAKEHELAFAMCQMILHSSQAELASFGHKTVEAGIVYTVKEAQKKIDKIWKDFLKKWPD